MQRRTGGFEDGKKGLVPNSITVGVVLNSIRHTQLKHVSFFIVPVIIYSVFLLQSNFQNIIDLRPPRIQPNQCLVNSDRKYYFEPHDRWVNDMIVKNKTNGVFLDAGILCPRTCSYSYYFEKELCWTGMCIDARSHVYNATVKTRTCKAYYGALCEHDGRELFWAVDSNQGSGPGYSGLESSLTLSHRLKIEEYVRKGLWTLKKIPVLCHTIDKIAARNDVSVIDLLTLDVEGAELRILEHALKSKMVRILAVVAETGEPDVLDALMERFNYVHIGNVGFDRGYTLIE
jgi:FkbM family methyltransferase